VRRFSFCLSCSLNSSTLRLSSLSSNLYNKGILSWDPQLQPQLIHTQAVSPSSNLYNKGITSWDTQLQPQLMLIQAFLPILQPTTHWSNNLMRSWAAASAHAHSACPTHPPAYTLNWYSHEILSCSLSSCCTLRVSSPSSSLHIKVILSWNAELPHQLINTPAVLTLLQATHEILSHPTAYTLKG
jgi:hypothetical protein